MTAHRYESLEDRFWQQFTKKGENKEKGCWEWTGTIVSNGYPRLKKDGKGVAAHRLSYEIHNGPIPEGVVICHTCDVKHCVNPAHLFLGTQKDNMQDMASKGRHRSQKIHPDQYQIIEDAVAMGETKASVARRYGVKGSTITTLLKKFRIQKTHSRRTV